MHPIFQASGNPAVHLPRSCQVVSEAPQQIAEAEEPQEVAVAEVEVSGMQVGKENKVFRGI